MSNATFTEMMTRDEAAEYIVSIGFKVTAGTLAQMAYRKTGPRYFKFGGRAMYKKDELDEWVKERTVSASNWSMAK